MRTAVRTSTENLKRATRWHRIRQYHELVYPSYGDPVDVLSFRTDEAITDKDPPQPDLDLVKVEMLHVPWNPADVNTIQGKYPSPYGFSSQNHNNIDRPSAKSRYFDEHLVAGSEGWGRVASSNGKYLKEGSLVTGILLTSCSRTIVGNFWAWWMHIGSIGWHRITNAE
jgi:hypothetical protein